MEGLDSMEELKPLEKARLLAKAIALGLPDNIPAAALPTQSKIPFKVVVLREMLFHRVSTLATPAVSLLESGNVVSGILLTRAVMETVAVVAVIGYELKKFLVHQDIIRFNDFLTTCLLGNRRKTDGIEKNYPAENIMNFIDAVTKKKKGYRTMYEELCEYAHPNFDGVLGSFGHMDGGNLTMTFGQKAGGKAVDIGADALAKALDILVRSYDGMAPNMVALARHFEPTWEERPNK